MKYILRITLLLIIYAVGILLFTRGFLLTRVSLSANSTCDDSAGKSTTPTKSLCPNEPRFRRAVLIVIDALRFDFVMDLKDSSVCDGDICATGRKLQILSEVALNRPFNSRLYRFIADPPTTTLQRLKGLTTGSLPTFVDAGANFASTEITEDNFIDQYFYIGKNITLMGDDTWQSLFPGRFSRSFPFPSFNVKDLDTVDNGVIKHLEKELHRPDWQLLIAHFLGVDHCGHTFGPDHPKMAEKLKQMDSVLRSVISQLDNETVLFVLGDHGMTSTGDHGGDSFDELDATLFVYSSAVISNTFPQLDEYAAVSQVDLVPTISLMLGIPVPFSNLGTVIVDLFDYDPLGTNNTLTRLHQKLTALQLNAQQVHRFLHKYREQSNDLPQFELGKLQQEFNEMEEMLSVVSSSKNISEQALVALTNRYIEYLGRVRNLCRSVWSKFDLVTMAVGGIVIVCAFLFNIMLAFCETNSTQLSPATFMAVSVIILSTAANLLQLLSFGLILLFTVLYLAFILITTFVLIDKCICSRFMSGNCCFQFLEVFSVLLCGVHSIALLSNSYVVYEDRTVSFIVQSLLIVKTSVVLFRHPSTIDPASKRRVPREFSWTSVHTILLFLTLACCIRLSEMFRSCREEQVDCDISWFAQPLSAILTKFVQFRLARLSVSLVSVVIVIAIVTIWLRHCGNMNGLEPAVIAMRYILPVAGICLCMYWLVDGFMLHNSASRLTGAGITALPRLVYLLSVAAIAVLTINPLCVLLLQPQQEDDTIEQLRNVSREELIAQICGHVRKNWRSVLKTPDASSTSDNTPVVYGLATVYSSGHIVLLTAVVMVIMLVLGDNMVPSIALWVICEISLLELHAAYIHCWSEEGDGVPWTSTALLSLLASQQFFATGHQATIAGIQWSAAFHGFREDHTTVWLPSLLVSLNTFASYILYTLSLPLLIYWPFTRGRWAANQHEKANKQDKGEFLLNVQGGEEVKSQVYLLIVRFLLLSAIKILSITLCVALHRRHLMVWKIFAPRYVYECAAFFVMSVCCVLTYLFVKRLNNCLTKWVQMLCTAS